MPGAFGGRAFLCPIMGHLASFPNPTIIGATAMQDGYAVNAADEADVDLEEGTGTESPEQIIAAVLTDVIEEIRSAPKAQRPAMLSAASPP